MYIKKEPSCFGTSDRLTDISATANVHVTPLPVLLILLVPCPRLRFKPPVPFVLLSVTGPMLDIT